MTTVYSFDVKRGTQAAQTDFYGVSGDNSLISSFHLQWDSALVCSGITVWATDFPENGSFSVPITSVVAGEWIQLNPSTGYTAVSPVGAATIAAGPLVLVVPGGTAGGAFVDIGNSGAHRLRVMVVCTTPGFLRIHAAGKF